MLPGRFVLTVLIVSLVRMAGPGVGPVLAESRPATTRPNIIFILTDDQRYDALGCMGNRLIRTPHIDRLAADGVLFRNMFCTTSICATSRTSFITGQYERRHHIDGFRTPLSKRQLAESFPVRLRKRGYRTGFVGKWGLGGPLPKQAWDVFEGFSGQGRYFPKGQSGKPGTHITGKLRAQALRFLDGCTRDKPFLLQLYTKAAHCQDGDPWPFQPDSKYNALFKGITIPKPVTATEKDFQALPAFLRNSEARKRWFVRFANDRMYQKSVKDYYRLVAGIDDTVGAIVAKLRAKNLTNNTVIIFTSDNGFYLGEHGLAGKWYMHEESIRLPLVIYDPRLPSRLRGRKVSQLVLNIDIAPTIFNLAGLQIPNAVQGRSMVPLLQGTPVTWRNDFLYEHRFKHPRIPKTEGVRTERWTYTRYTSIDPVYEELFDLKTDPHQQHNLAGDPRYQKKLRQLRTRWKELSRQAE